jgi:gamma-glutamyl hercynylcysteine S-oxide synthase
MTETPLSKPANAPREGMVKVAASQFNFQVDGIEIEGGNLAGVDVQYPWETIARNDITDTRWLCRPFTLIDIP